MKRNSYLFFLTPVVLLLLIAFVLCSEYGDMLFTAQDRNEFFLTSAFFRQTMEEPFGLMVWLGSCLTQFFYKPVVGVALLSVLWLSVYLTALRVFRLDRVGDESRFICLLLPFVLVTCLAVSITDVGYWIYILPLHGYWFSQSLSFLLVMLMLWAATATSPLRRATWYIIGVLAAFPFIGVYALFFALCLLVSQITLPASERSPWWHHLCCLVLTVLTPFFWARTLYSDMHLHQVLKAGLPYFQSTTVDSFRPSWPFVLLAVFTLLFVALTPYWDRLLPKQSKPQKGLKNLFSLRSLLALAVLALCFGIHARLSFRDDNYQAEMRMTQATLEDDWDTVIREAQNAKAASRTMVVLKNIALMHYPNGKYETSLGESSFALENSGEDINNPDSLNLNIMQIASPVVYYQYGKVQYAIRWCMENAVGYGFAPFYLKVYTRAALQCDEQALVSRNLHLLSKTLFHKSWRPKAASDVVKRLHVAFSDVIDSDNNDIERYLIQNFSMAMGSPDSLVKELNLLYAMIYRDPKFFWPALHAYASLHVVQRENTKTGERAYFADLPTHYQEAYLIMRDNYPADLPYKITISPMVEQNYKLYKQAVGSLPGMTDAQVGESLRQSWRHTYWWYIMYGRKTY